MTNETPSYRGDCVFWPPGNLHIQPVRCRLKCGSHLTRSYL
jgi:hypothetical protein